jgi:hypothetical protein
LLAPVSTTAAGGLDRNWIGTPGAEIISGDGEEKILALKKCRMGRLGEKCRSESAKAKSPLKSLSGLLHITSLTITYFHTGCSTIIGAKSFHGPVRDGKGWDRLAMVIRL